MCRMLASSLLMFATMMSTTEGFTTVFRPQQQHQWLLKMSETTTSTLDGRKISGTINPLNNFLLVKISSSKETTDGGILLTGGAKIKKTEGTVVAVGPGRTHPESGVLFDMPFEEGDGVVYGKYDGTTIDLDGEKHILIRDDDVLVKYRGDEMTIDNAIAIRDNVLVYVEKKEAETEGGILIAMSSTSDSRPSTGKVVSVGPGRMASNGDVIEMEVQVGDMIKFRDFAGNEVTISDQDYSVVRMSDILAKF